MRNLSRYKWLDAKEKQNDIRVYLTDDVFVVANTVTVPVALVFSLDAILSSKRTEKIFHRRPY